MMMMNLTNSNNSMEVETREESGVSELQTAFQVIQDYIENLEQRIEKLEKDQEERNSLFRTIEGENDDK